MGKNGGAYFWNQQSFYACASDGFDGTLRLPNLSLTPPPHLQLYLQSVSFRCSHPSSCPIIFLFF